MKKSIIATAVAAGLLATGAAQADPKVYGILHFSINTISDASSGGKMASNGQLNMTSNTSALGVKGSEDLGNGLKAIYKAEFKVDPFSGDPSGGSLQRRDVWVGLKGGWGKAAVGTMSSNYKQMGSKVDPLWRTKVEGRGDLNLMSGSGAHGGAGTDGGRLTNALQYTTPKMAGIEIVANYTFSDKDGTDPVTGLSNDETLGVGIRWSNKSFLVYADYIDPNAAGEKTGGDESMAKVGGKWTGKAFQVSAQYEMTEDQMGGDYIFANGLWNINKNNLVTVSVGQQDKVSSGYALAYAYKMSKQSNVYAAYGSVEEDSAGSYNLGVDSSGNPISDNSVISFGIRKSF